MPGAIPENGPLFCASCFDFDNYKLQTNIFWRVFWFILLFCFAFLFGMWEKSCIFAS